MNVEVNRLIDYYWAFVMLVGGVLFFDDRSRGLTLAYCSVSLFPAGDPRERVCGFPLSVQDPKPVLLERYTAKVRSLMTGLLLLAALFFFFFFLRS